MKNMTYSTCVQILIVAISTSLLSAQTSIRNAGNKAKTVEVEVKRYIPRNIQNTDKKTAKGNKEEKVIIDKVNLKFITYNQNKSCIRNVAR